MASVPYESQRCGHANGCYALRANRDLYREGSRSIPDHASKTVTRTAAMAAQTPDTPFTLTVAEAIPSGAGAGVVVVVAGAGAAVGGGAVGGAVGGGVGGLVGGFVGGAVGRVVGE